MKSTQTKFFRILTFALALVMLSSLVGVQLSTRPAAAQEPSAEEPVLSILIIPEGESFSVASVDTAPVFNVGDTFKVSIVALGVTDPGVFGGQFEVTYDTNHLQGVADSLASSSVMEPVVTAVSEINNVDGLVSYAASRQGDLSNLTGNVALASFNFEAVGATGEGQTTLIHLQNVKLGAKGGIEVPVSGLVDLEVIIIDGGNGGEEPGPGDITGNVKVQARADDNQADHEVKAIGDLGSELTDLTDENGTFLIKDAPADTYDVIANSPGFLKATCADVVHTADALTTLEDVTLLAGDIDDSGEIDITDASAIGVAFGTADEVADLNDDGSVNILDLILMGANFGQTSDANPWLCQLLTEL
jgi:hypothetical protein